MQLIICNPLQQLRILPMKTNPHPSVQSGFCLIPIRIAFGLGVAALLALPLGLKGQSNCVPVASNMVSWWRAEGNGNDLVGGYNAALLNGVEFTNGVVGQAFNLDGVDDQ